MYPLYIATFHFNSIVVRRCICMFNTTVHVSTLLTHLTYRIKSVLELVDKNYHIHASLNSKVSIY